MKQELIKSLKKYKWKILIEIILIVFCVIFIAYPSKLIGKMVDLLYNAEMNKTEIIKSVIQLLFVSLVIIVTRIAWKNLDFRINIYIDKDIRDRLFTKLLKAKVESLNEIKNGEIMSYFVSDLRKVTMTTSKFISTGTRIIANFAVAITMMSSSCNIKLTVISLIPVFATIVIIILIRNRMDKSFKLAQKSFTDLSEYVQESTDSVRTMKAFCGEEKQIEEFEKKNATLKKNNISVSINQNLLFVCVSFGFGIAYAISLLYGSNLVLKNEISIGDLIAFNGYLAILEAPVTWIPWLLGRAKKFKVSFDRLDKMFKLPEEEIEDFEKNDNDKLEGNIEIKNLTYNYPGYIETVLENININIKKGESLGIIGVIGSGKTTLMNLLLKLYDVERGKIFIDGKDINDIKVKTIRDNICYITQDNFLFSATLKENINLFKDEYKDEDIEESTKQAMIYDEISSMEEGINTVIGEKGIDLSGGQKQRVVISRAFLNNSNIIIFDDTFSALDNRTEQHVLNNIKELTKNKTCIIVSNRISDIKDCDKIIVLEQGEIVEQGTHQTLLKTNGKYQEFYQNQAHKAQSTLLD
ncbi:MAG TPA: ABC transporter ATP-binding protein/permease [Clostridiaceae bacterium]|jgi:ATP-binding cassette subfamily B multidrug efflux pump|nr:ABC transporter ATP-binding protein/permease [Clostridiaceae bacterium]